MGDLETDKKSTQDDLAISLLTIGCNNADIRDEIFLHLCRQTTQNPNPQSAYLGWELLVIALAAFAPSKNLEGHLAEFIQGHTTASDQRIAAISAHSLKKLAIRCRIGNSVSHILSKVEGIYRFYLFLD